MSGRVLVIGNKNYSSWSLRPWLLMRHFNLPFTEVRIALYAAHSAKEIAKYSPSGMVPALDDGDVRVWDSLAICEYVSETYLEGKGWPSDRAMRAHARSVSAEMHSGFANLRKHLSMNVRTRFQWQFINDDVERELQRIFAIWKDCRAKYAQRGPWLFGEFSIADAMYAPVVLRLQSYNVPVDDVIQSYLEQVLALPELKEWCAAGSAEREVLAFAENAQLKRLVG